MLLLHFFLFRRDGTLWWARPDTKTQVTCEYYFQNGACIPTRYHQRIQFELFWIFFVSRVHTVVVSTQHSEKVTLEALRKDIMEKVVLATIPKQYITPETKYHINPCGNFVIGGEKSLK